jgi:hypothetical protein
VTTEKLADQFWQHKTLEQMNSAEWEALCDGCAKCCLHKLEDEDTGEVHYTKVACRYMDDDNCQCTVYQERNTLVPECVWLKLEDIPLFHWLPSTCAYRLIAEGKPLYDWHPLVSGDPQSVVAAGVSIKGRVLSDANVHPDGMQEHIIKWIE